MSLVPYLAPSMTAVSRLVTPSNLATAARYLKPVAKLIYDNRDLFGSAAVQTKALVQKFFGSAPSKKVHRIPINSYASNSQLIRNPTFVKTVAPLAGSDMTLIGSLRLGFVGTFNTGALCNFALSGNDGLFVIGTTSLAQSFRLLQPASLEYLFTGDSVNPTGRLYQFSSLFARFRFRHVHLRYVPDLTPSSASHTSVTLFYIDDPATPGSFGAGTTSGTPLTSGSAALFTPSVVFPTWVSADLELNFNSEDWYYTNPESANISDTTDNGAVELRSACQGCIGIVQNTPKLASAQQGSLYMDYVIDFKDPILLTPDITVFRDTPPPSSTAHPIDPSRPNPTGSSPSSTTPSSQPPSIRRH